MNWGYKILLVYGLFVAGMIFLAYKSSQQNTELVTEDYYAKELVYQQKIDQKKRASLLSAPVKVGTTNKVLTIHFPIDFAGKEITGEALIYCPADKNRDLRQQFYALDSAVYIKIPENYRGLLYIKIGWSVAAVTYYYEQKVII